MGSGKENKKGLKKFPFMFLAVMSIFLIIPNVVNADVIINNNGVNITEEEYNDFLKVYTNEYIMNMSEEKYNKLKTLDFDDITTSTKYIETIYNPNLQITTERELTEEEFNNYSAVSPLLDDGVASYESTLKKLVLSIIGGTTWNWATVAATWKAIPSTRSYDVIGFYGYGFDFSNGTQYGEQVYTLNGNYTTISYAWNGTNIKRHDNGFGISMNIVNSDITYLQLIAECDVKATITHPTLYASYQHAQKSLSLTDSQNYTLGGSGLGNVFIFPYSISQKYDAMTGVYVEY